MADIKALISELKRISDASEEKRKRPGGALAFRIMHEKHSDEEWIMLKEEVTKFLEKASKQDLEDLGGSLEALIMICKGIEYKQKLKQ